MALWEKRGGQPNMADRFIRAIYREQQEGNAHIREMIERLVDADLENCEVRITMQQGDGGGGWRLEAMLCRISRRWQMSRQLAHPKIHAARGTIRSSSPLRARLASSSSY